MLIGTTYYTTDRRTTSALSTALGNKLVLFYWRFRSF